MKSRMQEIIDICNKVQDAHNTVQPYKLKAMKEALSLFPKEVTEVIDIGYVEGYQPIYDELNIKAVPYNLPNDMHDFNIPCKAVVMRHVLEHSPFPLLVIENIYQSLEQDGYCLVVVPVLNARWAKYLYHFSVLHEEGWIKLFEFVGFDIVKNVQGKWGKDPEHRFLLKKGSGEMRHKLRTENK